VPRFPLRTMILMILTLASFVWFYWATHRTAAPAPPRHTFQEVQVVPRNGDQ